eukprot:6189273-Pleurochrysis_carterae.AAC.2
MEAWIKPAKLAPMNIFCRSDEAYPMAAWSHQLRINAAGRLEHYLEADDKYTVFHTVNIVPGHWYHVAGIAQASARARFLASLLLLALARGAALSILPRSFSLLLSRWHHRRESTCLSLRVFLCMQLHCTPPCKTRPPRFPLLHFAKGLTSPWPF